jgi:hypothetical protein
MAVHPHTWPMWLGLSPVAYVRFHHDGSCDYGFRVVLAVLCRLAGVCVSPFALLTEFAPFGSLSDVIGSPPVRPELSQCTMLPPRTLMHPVAVPLAGHLMFRLLCFFARAPLGRGTPSCQTPKCPP